MEKSSSRVVNYFRIGLDDNIIIEENVKNKKEKAQKIQISDVVATQDLEKLCAILVSCTKETLLDHVYYIYCIRLFRIGHFGDNCEVYNLN